MDTKMKLPELRVGIDQQSLSLSYVIRASGLGGMNDKDALEVIARCNAAPKLVEALRNVVKWEEHENSSVPKVCPVCRGWNPEQQAYTKCNEKCAGAIGRAILKETGAEK